MEKFELFLDAFVNADTFLLFVVVMAIILFVLIMALFKTRNDVIELKNEKDNNVVNEDNFILRDIVATNEEDKIDENKPLIKQVNIPTIETYDDEINRYEYNEEESAVISADELQKVKEQRMNELGVSENDAIIKKYEEEQEKKAIISYEQLVKNASNITLTYKEEETKKGAPKINKIEVKEKEVTPAESYIDEEQFLKILKEFRLSLE